MKPLRKLLALESVTPCEFPAFVFHIKVGFLIKKQRKPNTKEFMLCLGPVLQCLATGEFLLHFFLCDTMKAPTSLGVK